MIFVIKIASLNHTSKGHIYCQDVEVKEFSILSNRRKFGPYTWLLGFIIVEKFSSVSLSKRIDCVVLIAAIVNA